MTIPEDAKLSEEDFAAISEVLERHGHELIEVLFKHMGNPKFLSALSLIVEGHALFHTFVTEQATEEPLTSILRETTKELYCERIMMRANEAVVN